MEDMELDEAETSAAAGEGMPFWLLALETGAVVEYKIGVLTPIRRFQALVSFALSWCAADQPAIAAEPVRYFNSTTFADSVVTFNEVMYRPATDAPPLEWIELHNQHVVIEDLSNWTIEGGVEFRFPPGTTIPGGGYLVVASNPAEFQAATGIAALGPFEKQLSNSGDHLVLRNLNRRLMDELDYRDSAPWPVAADGSGASLAKRFADSPSSPPENWRASAQVGGTPGAGNFPPSNAVPTTVIDEFVVNRAPGRWRVPTSADAETGWQAPEFSDAAWDSGVNGFGFDQTGTPSTLPPVDRYYKFDGAAADTSGNGIDGVLLNGGQYVSEPAPVPGSTAALKLDGIDDRVNIPDPGAHSAYTLSLWVKLEAVRPSSILVLTDGSGPHSSWSHQLRITGADVFEHYTFDGEWNVVTGTTHIQAGQWYHVAASAENGGFARLYVNGIEEGVAEGVNTLWGGGQNWLLGSDSAGFPNHLQGWLDEVGIWQHVLSLADVAQLAAGNSPGSPGRLSGLFNTDVGSAMSGLNASAWIRHNFTAPSPTGYDQLTLRAQYDDGFIAWLNGVEVARRNATSWAWNSVASAPRGETDPLTAETIDLTAHAHLLRPAGNVLAVQVLNASANDPDLLFTAELTGRRRSVVPGEAPPVAFSEVTAADQPGFFCEIVNTGLTPQPLADLRIRSSAGGEFRFESTALESGEFRTLGTNELGFVVQPGDRLFLIGAGGVQVMDAVLLSRSPQARRKASAEEPFLRPSSSTPGAPNTLELHDEIVINEILYHAPPTYARPGVEFAEDTEQWIELFNRSNHSVDLSGWKLKEDIDFEIPAGTTLAAGEYLVVSRDVAALRSKYPDLRIVGDWSGKLSSRVGHVRLLDAVGNPATEVRYFDDAPWPARADGGGGSLELRNPWIDPGVPEAWAASDESARSTWKTYTYRAKAIAPVKAPEINGFHEFRMGLLADGEALVDDVSVIEDPDGTQRELMQNGRFDDTRAWRLLGNHSHSRVVDDPDEAGNRVLRLVATDARGYMHNQLESTLKVGRSVVPVVVGRTYQISFRAKWLGGSPQLNTELYYNKVIQTTVLDIPASHGTPGKRNSTYVDNPGPTYSKLQHYPPVPKAKEPVTISVRATDPDGVAALQLFTSVNGAAWQTRPMEAAADGTFFAEVPGQAANAVVQFYVEGRDALGAASTLPAGGTNSRALYRVDSRNPKAPRKALHFVLTPADGRLMDAGTNMMSDDRIGTTVIWDNREIFYDCGVHLHGSMFTRSSVDSVPYNLKFPADHKFRGVHRTVQVNRGTIEEIIAKHAQTQAGLPGMYEDIVELFSHRQANAGAARMSLAHYNDIYLGSQFEDGTEGMLFNMEGIRVLQATHNNNPEGIKLGMPVGWVGDYDIMNLGNDPEQYRWSTTLRNNRSRNDYARYIAMAKVFSLSGAALEQAAPTVIDVDQWMRYYAMLTLFEIGDTYTLGNPHNIGFYARPSDGKVIALPYDWDFFFSNGDTSPLWGNQNLTKIISRPVYTRLLHGHLLDLIDSTFTTNYLAKYVTNFSQVSGLNFNQYNSRIRARGAYVRSRLPAKAPFEITSNGGADFAVDTPEATLEGQGWVDVNEIRLGGQQVLPVKWLDAKRWRMTMPLPVGSNLVQLEAFNRRGEKVGADSITVSTTAPDDSQRRSLRFSEIHYHPAPPTAAEFNAGFTDGDDFEFVEIGNYGAAAVSLQGVRLVAGVYFDFSDSTVTNLTPGARAVLVKNPAAFALRYGAGIPVAGAYSDGLSNSGERLQMVDHLGLVIHEVEYRDQSPWPPEADGRGHSLELIAPEGPIDAAAGWQAGPLGGSPGTAATTLEPGSFSAVALVDGKVHLRFKARAGQTYRLLARASAEAGDWQELQVLAASAADRDVDVEDTPGDLARFYRLASP